jgi:hypothetical protein
LTIRFGSSYASPTFLDHLAFELGFDVVKPRYEDIFLCVGTELLVANTVAARVGYNGQKYRPGDGLTLGGGVAIKQKLLVDYAWTPYGDLGSFHRLSVSIKIH